MAPSNLAGCVDLPARDKAVRVVDSTPDLARSFGQAEPAEPGGLVGLGADRCNEPFPKAYPEEVDC